MSSSSRAVLSLVVRIGLLLVVIGFSVVYLANQWAAVRAAVAQIEPLSLLLSMGFVILGLGAGTMAWVTLLNGLGPRVPVTRGAQIALVGALGKYVPGSVWAYVMQMEIGRPHGVIRPRVLITSLYAAGVGVVSSLLLGSLAMPTVLEGHTDLLWLFLLLPIGLACLHPRVMTWMASVVLRLAKRPALDHVVTFRTVLLALGWTLVSYALYGVHLWLLANSLVDPDLRILILLTGSVALGFTVGLFAFFLPSGVGVREAILIGAMTLVMTQAEGSALSLVSRLMFTVGDLATAGLAALAAFVALRRSDTVPAADPSPESS